MGRKRKRVSDDGRFAALNAAVAEGRGREAVAELEALTAAEPASTARLGTVLSALARDETLQSAAETMQLAERAMEVVPTGRAGLDENGYTALIKITAAAGMETGDEKLAKKARVLLEEMRSRDVRIKRRTYSPIVELLCSLRHTDEVLQLQKEAIDSGVGLDEASFFVILGHLSAAKRDESFVETLQLMGSQFRGLTESNEAVSEFFRSHGIAPAVVPDVDDTGKCPGCGLVLRGFDLSTADLDEILSQVEMLFFVSAEQKQALENLKQWLGSHDGGMDAVVDGANVGFFLQRPDLGGKLDYSQIDRVLRACIARGWGRSAVFLHERRAQNIMCDRWKQENRLFVTPVGMNDDWFWLYAALHSQRAGTHGYVVSNDQMRDHFCRSLASSAFPRWRERHLVPYRVFGDRVVLKPPRPLSRDMQAVDGDRFRWHFPLIERETEDSSAWLCCARHLSTHTS